MDVVGCCRAFLAVSTHGSFTAGAAATAIPQSVASRRVAALEAHVGARLFERTSRTVRLTPLGRDLLPSARRLVDVAEEFDLDAARAARRPLRLALPANPAPHAVARLLKTAASAGLVLDIATAAPVRRLEMVATREVQVALVPAAAGRWQSRLGLATGHSPTAHAEPRLPSRLTSLRSGRVRTVASARRVLVQVEDDVDHLRRQLTAAAGTAGLLPAQVVWGVPHYEALANVLEPEATSDVLLCSRAEAETFGLRWVPLKVPHLIRGYDLIGAQPDDVARVLAAAGTSLEHVATNPPSERR